MSPKKPSYEELEDRLKEAEATVAELRLMEEASRESEERWLSLTNNSRDIIQILDTGGTILYMNRVYPPHEMKDVIGKSVIDFVEEEFKVLTQESIEKLLGGEGPQTYEMAIRFSESHLAQFEVKFVPMLTKGKVDKIISLVTDITEKKRSEEELQKLAAVVKHSVELVNLSNLEGKMVFINEAGSKMLGIYPQELEQMNIMDVIPEHLIPLVQKELVPALMSGGTWEGDLQYKNIKTGEITDVHATTFSVNDPETNEPQFLANVSMDITERIQAEKELRRLRNYLANIIDSMPSVLVGVDADGTVTQWNSEAHRTTGVPAAIAVGQPLSDAFPRIANEMERVCEAMKTRKVRSDPRLARKEDGETRYEDVTIYPLISNGVEGAVIRVDDVTERVRIEEMMVQSEKMLSVGGLAAGMAHEINNPLAGIMQTTEVISNRLTKLEIKANHKAAQAAGTTIEAIHAFMEARDIINMLESIHSSGKRAARIVTNMLSFARKGDASFSTQDLAKLLDQTTDLAGSDYNLKKKFDFRQIDIVREYDDDLPGVPCEAGKIQQVLLNILRNGAEAMQENANDKPRFIMRLFQDPKNGMACIEIEDNGPGMDEVTCKRVFEPFFTTKPTDEGTGLGLSVSYFIIVEIHGGKISASSVPGKGTIFSIKLPLGSSD